MNPVCCISSRTIVSAQQTTKAVNSRRPEGGRVWLATSLALMAWASSGDPARSEQATPGVGHKPADAPVRIDGSNGILPLAAAIRRGYEARHDGAEVALGGGPGRRARGFGYSQASCAPCLSAGSKRW